MLNSSHSADDSFRFLGGDFLRPIGSMYGGYIYIIYLHEGLSFCMVNVAKYTIPWRILWEMALVSSSVNPEDNRG